MYWTVDKFSSKQKEQWESGMRESSGSSGRARAGEACMFRSGINQLKQTHKNKAHWEKQTHRQTDVIKRKKARRPNHKTGSRNRGHLENQTDTQTQSWVVLDVCWKIPKCPGLALCCNFALHLVGGPVVLGQLGNRWCPSYRENQPPLRKHNWNYNSPLWVRDSVEIHIYIMCIYILCIWNSRQDIREAGETVEEWQEGGQWEQ